MKHRCHFGVCFYFLSFLFCFFFYLRIPFYDIANFKRILPSFAHKDRTTCKIMLHLCTFFSTNRQVFSSVSTIKEKQCFRSVRLELYPSLFACHSDWRKTTWNIFWRKLNAHSVVGEKLLPPRNLLFLRGNVYESSARKQETILENRFGMRWGRLFAGRFLFESWSIFSERKYWYAYMSMRTSEKINSMHERLVFRQTDATEILFAFKYGRARDRIPSIKDEPNIFAVVFPSACFFVFFFFYVEQTTNKS